MKLPLLLIAGGGVVFLLLKMLYLLLESTLRLVSIPSALVTFPNIK